MDDDDGEDPFGSLIPFCYVSSSQEERLRCCPFAPEPYNPKNDASSESESESKEFPVESTGIVMVSLPESQEVENDNSNSHDVFHTPPEESAAGSSNELHPPRDVDHHGGDRQNLQGTDGGCGKTFAVGMGSSEACETVDLSRDSELGFSEVELAQRVEPSLDLNRSPLEASGDGLEVLKVLRRDLSLEDGLGESPSKKLKISERNSDKSRDELESERDTPEDAEINGCESSAKRKLEFSQNDEATKVVELEENDSILGSGNPERRVENGEINGKDKLSAKEFMETMEVLQQRDIGGEVQEPAVHNEQPPPPPLPVRQLPSSILGDSKDGDEEVRRELALLDVLKLIGEECDDQNNASCSFLEMAQRRGMTFPRVVWWPESGTHFGEG